jgi:excisionase family DNA binding protein
VSDAEQLSLDDLLDEETVDFDTWMRSLPLDPTGVTERLVTAAELAELLGFSPATIVDWAESGSLPCFKIGGRLRFRESEVLDWLEGRRVNGPEAGGGVSPTPTANPTRAA